MPKRIACRFCGEVCEATTPEGRSHWTHHHPAECPYREDEVPALNGVHVCDVWRNRYTGEERGVLAIKLGGEGVYTDREPVVILDRGSMPHPLWSLAEHWEPVTRPGEYPVPWEERVDERYPNAKPMRWALDAWRGPEHRGHTDVIDWEPAYWHARHTLDGYCSTGWEWWQIDPAALDPEQLAEPTHDEQMALAV